MRIYSTTNQQTTGRELVADGGKPNQILVRSVAFFHLQSRTQNRQTAPRSRSHVSQRVPFHYCRESAGMQLSAAPLLRARSAVRKIWEARTLLIEPSL